MEIFTSIETEVLQKCCRVYELVALKLERRTSKIVKIENMLVYLHNTL